MEKEIAESYEVNTAATKGLIDLLSEDQYLLFGSTGKLPISFKYSSKK